MNPLVSVICISYNHAPYIQEALNSVFSQNYDSIEIIIADDGSNDDSQAVIKNHLKERDIQCLFNTKNIGYTKTFNQALRHAKGEFIIDFALDDVMNTSFVSASIARFKKAGKSTGVVFSNADYIDEESSVIGNHNDTLFQKKMIDSIPEGDVFSSLIARYFICTPTMVIRKEVFDRLGGYDESLAYEDFDFWIRSSRYWDYAYADIIQMQKRKLKTSMSANRYHHQKNEQLASVLTVCKKAFHLCKTNTELSALKTRLNYEYRQCLRNRANDLASKYEELIGFVGGKTDLASMLVKFLKRDFKRKIG
ncbi:glycosyltransferase family 2 protein [Roseivirga sp.]|uniref:glycosyltransferase family 2 protein n=1 Tax=Roseivirga sp. TaxID=1964215 RepID=UPI003B8C956F